MHRGLRRHEGMPPYDAAVTGSPVGRGATPRRSLSLTRLIDLPLRGIPNNLPNAVIIR